MTKDLLLEFATNGLVKIPSFIDLSSAKEISDFFDQELASKTQTSQHTSTPQLFFEKNSLISLSCKEPIIKLLNSIIGANYRVSYVDILITSKEEHINTCNWDNYSYEKKSGLGIHRDGAFINYDLSDPTESMLSLKLGISISEQTSSHLGNFCYLPKSHLTNKRPEPSTFTKLILNQGDAFIFDRRLLHGRTPNFSSTLRKMIFIEYSPRWMKRKINFNIPSNVERGFSKIERQLFLNEEQSPWELYWPSSPLPTEMIL